MNADTDFATCKLTFVWYPVNLQW